MRPGCRKGEEEGEEEEEGVGWQQPRLYCRRTGTLHGAGQAVLAVPLFMGHRQGLGIRGLRLTEGVAAATLSLRPLLIATEPSLSATTMKTTTVAMEVVAAQQQRAA